MSDLCLSCLLIFWFLEEKTKDKTKFFNKCDCIAKSECFLC
jgi:SET domain-containing protein